MSLAQDYLQKLKSAGGTELVLATGHAPAYRGPRELRALPGEAPMDDESLRRLMVELIGEASWELQAAAGHWVFAATLQGAGRVRGACTTTRDGLHCVLRLLPEVAPSCESVGLPPSIASLADLDAGLVLVTGPVQSGKSTTLAALVSTLNERHARAVITLEDPVEHLHQSRKSVVSQRQVGAHCESMARGIKGALSMNADVIVVDGLHSAEALQSALMAASLGVLVFASMRVPGAARALDRLIAAFPRDQRSYACADLSDTLAAVISQELVPSRDAGQVLACEILLRTHNLTTVLRDGKTAMIAAIIDAGRALGMQTLDSALLDLVKQDVIDGHLGYERAADKKPFAQWAQ